MLNTPWVCWPHLNKCASHTYWWTLNTPWFGVLTTLKCIEYVLVICAKVNDCDPLPRFPNVDRSLDSNPIAILNTSELRFHPKGIVIQQIGQWCSWDQVEIAFHFPDIPGLPNTPHHLPAEIRPVLLPSTTLIDTYQIVPYDINPLQCCIAINGNTSYMALSQIYHTFCVPNKECPEKNENSEEEQMKHLIKRHQYQWRLPVTT